MICDPFSSHESRQNICYEAVFKLKLEKLTTPDVEYWSFPLQMDQMEISDALVKMAGFSSGGKMSGY